MKVKLVSYTTPSAELLVQGDIKNAQELVAFCARVSNPNHQINNETSENLIRYLMRHSHWSPLEMVDVTLEVETTRDVSRQMIRHKSFAVQEFSQRYASPLDYFNFERREARIQDHKNRQNSFECDNPLLDEQWRVKQQEVINLVKKHYNWAIKNKIAKEVARAILPEGMTVTKLYFKGSIRSWITYLDLRSGNGTQKEHIELAKEMAKVISIIFPMIKETI